MEKKIKSDMYKLLTAVFTAAGFVMRVLCCTWGRPYELHPDEPAVVPYAIDMIKRHSWLVYSYSRPDQLEIKCDALIFQAASYLKYHVSADAAFGDHTFFFYFLARLFTAAAGTALIPLSALLAYRIFRGEEINAKAVAVITAGMTAFSYLFVQHSAYATPDIPLTLFMAGIAYFSVNYLEKGRFRDLVAISVITGLAVTIKYPAAIFTVYIALTVIYKAIKEKRYKDIFVRGILCALIMAAAVFAMAPNLFTDFSSVVSAFMTESNPSHLGADGLGFAGNMKYYFSTVWDAFGFFSMPMFAAGIVYLIMHRKSEHLALCISAVYWILLSVLPLHWIRWGFPMYIAYMTAAAAGCVWIFSLIRKYIKKRSLAVCTGAVYGVICSICAFSIVLGAVTVTVWSRREDTRVYSAGIVNNMGINNGNCFCEAYTPLTMNGGGGEAKDLFAVSGNVLRLNEKYAGREYFMTSVSYRTRFMSDPVKYADVLKTYDMIPENYKCIFSAKGSYTDFERNELKNIEGCIKLLKAGGTLTGSDIELYGLGTEFVTVKPYSDTTLNLMISDNNGSPLPGLYYDKYTWTEYKTGDTETIMSRDNDMVLTEQSSDGGYVPAVTYIEGESDRHWTVKRENGYACIISSAGMALTYRDGTLTLEKYTGDDTQKWVIEPAG